MDWTIGGVKDRKRSILSAGLNPEFNALVLKPQCVSIPRGFGFFESYLQGSLRKKCVSVDMAFIS
jgi:hypothetical protein